MQTTIRAQPLGGAVEPARHIPPYHRVVITPLTSRTILELANPTPHTARFTLRGARPDNYGYLHDAVYELDPGDVRLVRFADPSFFQVNEYGDAVLYIEDGVELGPVEFPVEFQRVLIGAFEA